MSGVRVLVGTRKGAFVLTSDGKRDQWDISGPHFAGWEIYHMAASPADPARLYASQSTGWFGQLIQRSTDGGTTWEPVGNKFEYDGDPGTHRWYDGTPHPWEFARVWHLEPSLTDPDTVFAGVEDAGLFRSIDAGQTWQELAGLRRHESAPSWQPGAGGMCLHTIVLDPRDPARMFAAISAAGVFRSDDAGETWWPANRGLRSEGIPDPDAEVGHCVHRIAMHPARPDVLFMQKHWDVMRSDDAGKSWQEVSGDLPTDFGFTIDVHAHEPDTIFKATATSTCFGTRWPSTRSTSAVCTSARRVGRYTCRPTPGTTGHPLSVTFHRCCPWKSRRCRDPGSAAYASAQTRMRGRRGETRRFRPAHAATAP